MSSISIVWLIIGIIVGWFARDWFIKLFTPDEIKEEEIKYDAPENKKGKYPKWFGRTYGQPYGRSY